QPYPDEHTHTVGTEVVIGALCLHYRKKFEVFISPEDATVWAVWNINGTQQPVTAPKETLEWMGRFTAQALDRSREAIQRRTLLKLNELAGRWLVESIRHPNDARRGYLEALVKFIESEFKIEAISIFYRKDQRSGKVFLLHTTGICLGTEPEKILPEHRWAELTYEIGEAARTAQCFANGKEMPLNDGIDICNSSTSAPKSFEVRPVGSGPVDTKDWKDPALLLPIPLPASEQPGSDGDLRAQALGVMRFAYHRWKRFGEQNRPFDPVEIQTLMFLTEQIGPVLETMANNIEVDRAVSNQRHELRNSMRVINQLVEQMTHGMASPKTDQKTEVLAFNLWDLKFSAMLARNQVQRLYRDEIEKKPLEIEETLIYGTIIARLCDVLGRYAMKEKRIKLNLDHHSCARLPKLHVDRWYVEQALLNLLLNAVKYGDDGSEIRVWCLDDRDGYSILVKGDKGIGIASEDKERVFERGYRTESAREIAKGAGLGLHITKLIMRRHEGDVRLVSFSSPTTFSLWFPAARRFSAPQP
ncbi:MAG TPA: sensor histidine kinase, partial [Prosthecobacter sp.]